METIKDMKKHTHWDLNLSAKELRGKHRFVLLYSELKLSAIEDIKRIGKIQTEEPREDYKFAQQAVIDYIKEKFDIKSINVKKQR